MTILKIVTDLQEHADNAREYFARCRLHPLDKDFGVGSNTYRSFRSRKNKPSATYRKWAKKAMKQIESLEIPDENIFLIKHEGLACDISNHFANADDQPITLGQKYKLVDLFLKFIVSSGCVPTQTADAVLEYGRVPLDSRVLSAMKAYG